MSHGKQSLSGPISHKIQLNQSHESNGNFMSKKSSSTSDILSNANCKTELTHQVKKPLVMNHTNSNEKILVSNNKDLSVNKIQGENLKSKQYSTNHIPEKPVACAKIADRKALFERSNEMESGSRKTNESKSTAHANIPNGIKVQRYTGAAAIASMIKQDKKINLSEENETVKKYNNSRADIASAKVGSSTPPSISPKPKVTFVHKHETGDSSLTKQSLNMSAKSVEDVNVKHRTKKTSNGVHRRLTQLLDPSDVQVSKFLAAIANMSSDQEEKTGNGKLDMQGILTALATVTENKLNNAECQENVYDVVEANDKNTDSGIVEWKKVIVRSHESENLIHENAFNEKSENKNTDSQENTTAEKYDDEKNTVLNELNGIFKSKKETENSTHLMKDLKPAGFKMPPINPIKDPSEVNAKNPAVKRIVYNQYREMLKSYSASS